MKLSVSLPDDDIAFLDDYAQSEGLASRSAALHRAVMLLRAAGLAIAYEDAWRTWGTSDDAADWEVVTGDGLHDAAR